MANAEAKKGFRITPTTPAFILLLAMDVVGAPFLTDYEGLSEEIVFKAYGATLVAVVMLAVLYYVFGIGKKLVSYQVRPVERWTQKSYLRLWWGTVAVGFVGIAIMFYQAGFRVPVLTALGTDKMSYQVMRTDFREAIQQNLFYIVLYVVAVPNALVAWFHLEGKILHKLFSLVFVGLVGSFTLARSPLGLAGLIAFNYAILSRSISWRFVLIGSALPVAVILGMHFVGEGEQNYVVGYDSMYDYLGQRVIYGEWTGLPWFFQVFEHQRPPVSSLLHPVLQDIFGLNEDSPARIVMIATNPMAVAEGRGGVANTFFIGDAYAVAGMPGVFAAPFIVMFELWVACRAFAKLPKSPITVCLYAIVLFKLFMGILAGLSAFLFASTPLLILIVVVAAEVYTRVRASRVVTNEASPSARTDAITT